jgi:ketosteroid isomerase-like protein
MLAAMSGAEIVKRWLQAFNDRDGTAMIALAHSEVEFAPITAAMEGRVYRSPDEIHDFLPSLDLDWEFFETRPQEFYEVGDRALALGTWRAKGRGSGLELESHPGGWLATIRNGLVYRWRTYTDPAEALAELGVRERRELAEYRVYPP